MAAVAVKLKLLSRKSSQQLCEESSATVAWTRGKTKKATGAYTCTIRKAMPAASSKQSGATKEQAGPNTAQHLAPTQRLAQVQHYQCHN